MWHESIYVNLYFTISESLTGVRLKSKSGMKKPSNCPISSSRITPSANWTANPQSIGTLKVIREVITESIFIKRKPVSSRRFPAVYTCLSISITCRPRDDICWLTKCTRAYNREIIKLCSLKCNLTI